VAERDAYVAERSVFGQKLQQWAGRERCLCGRERCLFGRKRCFWSEASAVGPLRLASHTGGCRSPRRPTTPPRLKNDDLLPDEVGEQLVCG